MRGVGTAAVAIVALTVLAGCGGTGGGSGAPGTPSPEVTASASPAASRATVPGNAAVRRDIRAALAAGGITGVRFPAVRPELLRAHPCQVVAQVDTHVLPDRKAVAQAVAVLEQRGWEADGPFDGEDGLGYGYSLSKEHWILSLAAASLTEEQLAAMLSADRKQSARKFTGLLLYGGTMACDTATPSP
ncbi:hypothetical protein JS756_12100 [Streptomyces actuosus]|uniref:DUF3558 domain-containing protein n=1 Tax=Streptomyces actuosus TaxID=1885 RepID=A0ABS2VP55_STRAS|nr:hypothetical protein [Streptomyces actuosus]MBN0044840.1 hypothetical protein [Streptomyces actuosus]